MKSAFHATSKVKLASLAIIASLASGCMGTDEIDPEKQFDLYRETAFYHWQNSDLPRTEYQVLKALEIHPEDFTCNLYLGNIGIKKGNTQSLLKAEQVFRNMVEQDDYRTDLGLAEVLERLGIVYLEAASNISTGQKSTDALDPAARVLELREMSKNAWIESRARYQQVLDNKPKEAKAVNGMQRVFGLEGNYEASLYWNQQLLDMIESDITYFKNKLAAPGATEREEVELRMRMSNTLDLAERSHMFAATVLHDMGKSEPALEHLVMAAEIQPRSAEIWSHRAEIQFDLGQHEACVESLEQFIRLSTEAFDHPDIQSAYDLIARSKDVMDDERFEETLRVLREPELPPTQ